MANTHCKLVGDPLLGLLLILSRHRKTHKVFFLVKSLLLLLAVMLIELFPLFQKEVDNNVNRWSF